MLDRAILLAANDNAELYIGHVIDSTALEAAGTFPVDVVPSLEKAFRESIDAKVRAAEANPSIKKVEVIVRAGRIRETIKDEMLDVINPDLVICGASRVMGAASRNDGPNPQPSHEGSVICVSAP